MEKTNLRDETDRLCVRIETLQCALAQILALRHHGYRPPNQTAIIVIAMSQAIIAIPRLRLAETL
jgi:hypothetical protein